MKMEKGSKFVMNFNGTKEELRKVIETALAQMDTPYVKARISIIGMTPVSKPSRGHINENRE